MKNKYSYLLTASAKDTTGLVASLSGVLFQHRCNLEDSSMMRLAHEFGIFLIFSSPKPISMDMFQSLSKKFSIELKPLSPKEAAFVPAKPENLYKITLYGTDKPGLVYAVTSCLAKSQFNITDVATHRTTQGNTSGFILMIEGELKKKIHYQSLQRKLHALQKKLNTHISIRPLVVASI